MILDQLRMGARQAKNAPLYTLRVQVDGNDFAIMFLISAPSSLSVAQRPLCFPEVDHKS